ncbi:substrate-binding domain-containing protein [Streptomyces sp. 1331.2]|uniref:substrate-binding domain-containing protein n=1 Tax=Streptomyces sp. 1331.2 TaxID=1938835 RepID=UPI000BD32CCD|nr:substrate-binding domain-containing protein [Streptomyces sp. 1331.2]SOB84689.1 extracellular solute-binding protein [Streptomyces sp. 1331.2]
MKRVLGVVAALALLGWVAYALIPEDRGAGVVTVSGLIGSEKRDFFDNPDVKAELRKRGLEVRADSTGSWTMSEQAKNTKGLDFAFPASAAPARDIQRNWELKDSPLVPFYSPLVIVTHEPAAQVLRQNQLADVDEKSGVWTFRMDRYVEALRGGRKWKDLKGAAEYPELAGMLYVSTTDPDSSSSGAMYLALLAYVANGNQVVSDDAGVNAVRDVLATANRLQGMQKISSDEPFRDFFAGVGTLVLAYESQAAALPLQGKSTGDMVVMYPDTTVQSDHTLVARTDGGRKLADVLENDGVLRGLEARFGLRPQEDQEAFWSLVKGFKKPSFAHDLRSSGYKQATLPSLDNLQKLTNAAKGNG